MTILLSEQEVLMRWPALSKSGLRAARKAGRISFIRGKRGSAWYREEAIETFIETELEHPCHAGVPTPYSQSETNGSQKIRSHLTSTDSGQSPELAELVARRSAQRISKKQR